MFKKIYIFFDRLEDLVRAKLSHYPILYGFFGGIGVVLFWRGVWHAADEINLSSVLSIVVGSILLLIIGAFVSTFIGNKLIISGLAEDKKIAQKVEKDLKHEEAETDKIQQTLDRIESKVDTLEAEIISKNEPK